MQNPSVRQPEHGTIEASVMIKCPVEMVFSFYRDFKNLPRFLGDVTTVEQIGPETYRWTIEVAFGFKVPASIRMTEVHENALIRYETITPAPLKTRWKVLFMPGPSPGETEVIEVMHGPMGLFGRAALALIGKFPGEEVAANLRRLKQVMETGKVTDTSYTVRGKFDS